VWVVYHVKLLKCGNEVLGSRLPNKRKRLRQTTLHALLEGDARHGSLTWIGVMWLIGAGLYKHHEGMWECQMFGHH